MKGGRGAIKIRLGNLIKNKANYHNWFQSSKGKEIGGETSGLTAYQLRKRDLTSLKEVISAEGNQGGEE